MAGKTGHRGAMCYGVRTHHHRFGARPIVCRSLPSNNGCGVHSPLSSSSSSSSVTFAYLVRFYKARHEELPALRCHRAMIMHTPKTTPAKQ
uniref:Uncharacterized protein n=1 Tax=Anopheles quadriannulatus TaxID=34691 RepID=A0A182WTH9_ANOQN